MTRKVEFVDFFTHLTHGKKHNKISYLSVENDYFWADKSENHRFNSRIFSIVYDAVEKPGFIRTNTFFWSKKIDTLGFYTFGQSLLNTIWHFPSKLVSNARHFKVMLGICYNISKKKLYFWSDIYCNMKQELEIFFVVAFLILF